MLLAYIILAFRKHGYKLVCELFSKYGGIAKQLVAMDLVRTYKSSADSANDSTNSKNRNHVGKM